MDGSKSIFLSKGVIGGVVAAAAGIAGLAGYIVDSPTQAELAGTIEQIVMLGSSIASLVGGLLAAYGRIKATKKIR